MNIHFHMSPASLLSVAKLRVYLFFQAGLDKMSQGHMLADVVTIIGETLTSEQS